jgi:hypothetical protein
MVLCKKDFGITIIFNTDMHVLIASDINSYKGHNTSIFLILHQINHVVEPPALYHSAR